MRIEKITCDRCNRDLTYDWKFARMWRIKSFTWVFDETSKHPISNEINLCNDCYKKFEIFMKGEGE